MPHTSAPARDPGSERPTTPGPSATPYRWRWAVLAIVLVAEVMDLLDATVTSVAAPTVTADLDGGDTAAQWLGAAYTLPMAVLLIGAGRMGDLWGRRRLFLVGAAGFTVSSAVCAAAPGVGTLLAARVVQGAFAALLLPQGFGLLRAVFPASELGKAFGAFGPVMGLSAVGGPILGGALSDVELWGAGWRLIFVLNVPLGVAAVACGSRLIPADGPRPAHRTLDVPGMLLATVASGALVYPLVQGRELGWPWWSFGLAALGLAGFGLFLRHERGRVRDPLIEPSLLANRTYLSGICAATAFFAAFTGIMLVLSLFLQAGPGYSPTRTGLALCPLALGLAITAGPAGSLARRRGRTVIQGGILVTAVGLAATAALAAGSGPGTGVWHLVPGTLLTGLGMGAVIPPLFDVILAGVADHEVGSASGVLNAVQQFASAIGVALLGTCFFSAVADGHTPSSAAALTLLTTVGILLVALVPALRLPARARAEGTGG